jgi:hypothetical protein
MENTLPAGYRGTGWPVSRADRLALLKTFSPKSGDPRVFWLRFLVLNRFEVRPPSYGQPYPMKNRSYAPSELLSYTVPSLWLQ